MTKTPRDPKGHDAREARLKAALRANLARRKAQGRARADDGAADDRADDGNTTNEQNGPKTPPNGRSPENEE
ncbi:hypothetical protein [Paracoccus sp. (in: a-proteobacteria)]|uniref:hypothetical protein n=1 Tax=Paracoccus sp. TaxID=267 RepID=UPI0035B20BFE